MSNLLIEPCIEAAPIFVPEQRGELQTVVAIGSGIIQLSADPYEGVLFADIFNGKQPITPNSTVVDRSGRVLEPNEVYELTQQVG